jgi:hypothetical protein
MAESGATTVDAPADPVGRASELRAINRPKTRTSYFV